MLDVLFSHYSGVYKIDAELQRVAICEVVASALAGEFKDVTWTWRYVHSIRHKKMKPGRVMVAAIERQHKKIESIKLRLAAPKKYSYKHIKIRKDDATSAAATIRKAATVEYRMELSELLRG